MNIFVLHKNPRKAAKMLCDQHVTKMTLETAQILCSVRWITGSEAPYKPTHIKHPCVLWTKKSLGNYKWLVKHGLALAKEFKKRYKKQHKCREIILWCKKNYPEIPRKGITKFAQAMPEKYKDENPVKAYQNYYLQEKLKFCKWKKSNEPKFVKKYLKNKDLK